MPTGKDCVGVCVESINNYVTQSLALLSEQAIISDKIFVKPVARTCLIKEVFLNILRN